MTKALLTNLNSVWGTIINPQSSNTYRHILSFDNDDLKKQFIDKELFEGKDHIALLAQQPKIALSQHTGNLATFRVNPMDYPDETIDTLLNKDFAIIQENSKTRYYTLVGTRKGTQIEYVADLDIFFTHDIKDMFNDKESRIERAMIDRVETENGITKFITNVDNQKWVSQIYNSEPIDQIPDENLIPTKYEILRDKVEKYLHSSVTDDVKEQVIKTILDSRWNVIYRSVGRLGAVGNIWYYNNCYNSNVANYSLAMTKNSNYGTFLPYATLIAPNQMHTGRQDDANTLNWYFAKTEDDFNNGTNLDILSRITKAHIEQADVIQNTYSVLSTSLFNVIEKMPDDFISVRYDKVSGISVIIKAITATYNDFNKTGGVIPVEFRIEYNTGDAREKMLLVRAIQNNIDEKETSEISKIKPLPEFINFKDQFDISKKTNKYDTEIKSWFAPYRKIKLRHSTKLEKVLIAQNFKKNEISIKQQYSFIPELWNHIAKVESYNNIGFETENIPSELQEQFEDIAPYGFPTEQNAYQSYITSHRSQMTSGIFQSLGQGGMNLGASVATKNPFGVVGSLTSTIGSIADNFALKADLQRTPLKVNQTSSTLSRETSYKDFRSNLTEYKLPEYLLVQIRKFFYQFGYSYNNNLANINDLLKTRYYFNFIQIPQSFENMKIQLSGSIKQIINDTLAEGVHIWHIRDLNTFRGVKDYSYENVEMKYIESLNNAKK